MNDYSQEDLAKKIGVSRQAISKWERDDSIPDLVNGTKLCSLFNITIEDLLNDSFEDIDQNRQDKKTILKSSRWNYIVLSIKLILIIMVFLSFNHFLNLYLAQSKETYQFSFTIYYGLQLVPYFALGTIVYFKTENSKASMKLLLAYVFNIAFLFLVFSILTNPFLPIINQESNMWLRSLIFFTFGIYLSYLSYKII